jgi:hypothetical protein
MEWPEFFETFASEMRRLGLSESDMRFFGFDEPNPALFESLRTLPDGAGVEIVFRHLGADWNELVRQEKEWRTSSPDA